MDNIYEPLKRKMTCDGEQMNNGYFDSLATIPIDYLIVVYNIENSMIECKLLDNRE